MTTGEPALGHFDDERDEPEKDRAAEKTDDKKSHHVGGFKRRALIIVPTHGLRASRREFPSVRAFATRFDSIL